jgi:tetratricopeptide (TPR) repeat protein/tRNA A-37 threonylcarbamoyl transferase component Bud32
MEDEGPQGDPARSEDDATRTGGGAAPSPAGAGIPRSIGGYRILRKLGEGGMGVVYEAEQRDPRRIVALKVIRGGASVDETQVRMFQREVETLARLQHPDIGSIYESGRTEDGTPWFAMELVRGTDLAAYIASRPKRITPDELRHRLRLLVRIAQAVHHAHQRGVIHRDLKPSNIIVTEPAPGSSASAGLPDVKILDFGLARLTDEDVPAADMLTVTGAIKGTLPYMSPEQARGETGAIDVRTDVYALGVVLYEMLAGRRPHDVARASLLEAVRVICEEPPRPISTTYEGTRRLDADVETIVGKALQKEPERRYDGAAALADDVERYLASLPIAARPPSAAYQARKFAQRHRPLVIGAGATALAVVAGLVVSTVLYFRAERERKSAQQVAAFLSSMLEGVGAQVAQGRDTTLLRDILRTATERVGSELGDEPAIEARLRGTMGLVYYQISSLDDARTQWDRAMELYAATYGEDSVEIANMHANLGLLSEAEGDHPAAENHLRQAIDIVRRVAGPKDPLVADFESRLANQLVNQARYDEARALLESALARQRAASSEPGVEVAITLTTLGNVAHYQGKLDDAEAYYVEALATHRAAVGEKHPFVANGLMNLSFLLDKRGKLAEAEAGFRDALARYRTLFPDGSVETAACLSTLAGVLQRGGAHEEAEALAREAVAINEKLYGPDSDRTGDARNALGVVLADKGDLDAASEEYERALAIRRKVHGPRHPRVAASLNNVGMIALDRGRFEDAEKHIAEAAAISEATAGPDSPDTFVLLNNLARARAGAGDVAGAEKLFRDVIEKRRKVLGEKSPHVAVSEYWLSMMLRDEARPAEAEPLAREAATIMSAALGPGHHQAFNMEVELGEVLIALGKTDEAHTLLGAALERAVAKEGPGAKISLTLRVVLDRAHTAAGDAEAAIRDLDDVVSKGAVLTETGLAYARLNRGAALAAAGREREARSEIEAVQARLAAKYAPDHRLRRLASRMLAGL